jgi:hypothetical protein
MWHLRPRFSESATSSSATRSAIAGTHPGVLLVANLNLQGSALLQVISLNAAVAGKAQSELPGLC